MVPIVCIVGRSNSGKTTLIEKLIPELAERGYRVGTIKHHHAGDFEADQPGKDSWRHARAGAVATALVGRRRMALFQRLEREPRLEAIARLFTPVPDLVLAEGYKHAPYPKIEVVRAAVASTPLCGREDGLVALVTDTDGDSGVPRFGLEDVEAIATHIVAAALVPVAGARREESGRGAPQADASVAARCRDVSTVLLGG
jgi:molybdopterin-guanine dinucleotide biosynthesis protein B